MENVIDIKDITNAIQGSMLVPVMLSEIVDEDGLLTKEIISHLDLNGNTEDIIKIESIVRSVSKNHVDMAYLTSVLNALLTKSIKPSNVTIDSSTKHVNLL